MTDRLRTIAVTVEESGPGTYHWVLIERIDDPTCFVELFGSLDIFDEWDEALDAGVAALKSLTLDPAIGPRLEDEAGDPIGRRVRRSRGPW
jgi:hypothetical protein